MRVVVAEDDVLLREGIVRVLRDGGFEVVGAVGDADALLDARRRASRPTSRSSTSGCRRPTPTRGCVAAETLLRARSGRPGRGPVAGRRAGPRRAPARRRAGRGRLPAQGAGRGRRRPARRDRAGRPRRHGDRSGGRRRARRRGVGRATRSTSSRRASARCSGSWPRAARTGRSRRRLVVGDKTVETHVASIFSKLGLEERPDDHRRVLAVLTWLRRT